MSGARAPEFAALCAARPASASGRAARCLVVSRREVAMEERPTFHELLAAIERFLDEEIVPNTPGARGFHTRVAANAIPTVRRELEAEDEQLAAEWAGLDGLLRLVEQPVGRAALREGI